MLVEPGYQSIRTAGYTSAPYRLYCLVPGKRAVHFDDSSEFPGFILAAYQLMFQSLFVVVVAAAFALVAAICVAFIAVLTFCSFPLYFAGVVAAGLPIHAQLLAFRMQIALPRLQKFVVGVCKFAVARTDRWQAGEYDNRTALLQQLAIRTTVY